jgi:opacity protein-like surface antigen
MKITPWIGAGILVVITGLAQAQQKQTSNYAALRVGNANNDISGLQAINPRVTGVTGSSIDDSSLMSLAFGHRYRSNWRSELEFTDRRSANMVVNTVGAGFSGRNDLKAKSSSLMANAYYDMPMANNFLLFGQLGLGYARVKLGGEQYFQAPANTGPFTYGTTFPSGTKGNLAWSLGLGGEFKLTQQFSLDFGARHINLGKMETRTDTVNGDEQFKAKLSSNELYGGLRFSF